MRIFAISDLHLSLTAPYCTADTASPQLAKPMSVFGAGWHDFFQRLCSNWCAQVTAEDAVLLDTSELDFEQSLAAMKEIIAAKLNG